MNNKPRVSFVGSDAGNAFVDVPAIVTFVVATGASRVVGILVVVFSCSVTIGTGAVESVVAVLAVLLLTGTTPDVTSWVGTVTGVAIGASLVVTRAGTAVLGDAVVFGAKKYSNSRSVNFAVKSFLLVSIRKIIHSLDNYYECESSD
jgi:hypothetical protein